MCVQWGKSYKGCFTVKPCTNLNRIIGFIRKESRRNVFGLVYKLFITLQYKIRSKTLLKNSTQPQVCLDRSQGNG